MKQSVTERLYNLLIYITSTAVVGEEENLTINKIAERFELPVFCVRNDIAELVKSISKNKSGIFIGYENEELYVDKRKIKKIVKSGKLDDELIIVSYEDMQLNAFINLDYKEYAAVLKVTEKLKDINNSDKGNVFFSSPKYTGEELYKICQDYNAYSIINNKVHTELIRAIENDEWKKILYKSKKKIEFINIKPIRIVEYESSGRSYVITLKGKKLEPYRLDKIIKVENPDKNIANKSVDLSDNPLLEKIDYIWGMDNSNEFDVKFKVFNDNNGKVIEKVKRDLKHYIDHAGYKIEDLDGGHIMVTGKVIGKSDFERYIRSYGASIVVYEPQEIVDDIIKSNKEKLEMYKS